MGYGFGWLLKFKSFSFPAQANPQHAEQSAAHSLGVCPRVGLTRPIQHLLPHTKSLPYTRTLLINEPHTANCSFQETKNPNMTHPSFTLSRVFLRHKHSNQNKALLPTPHRFGSPSRTSRSSCRPIPSHRAAIGTQPPSLQDRRGQVALCYSHQ